MASEREECGESFLCRGYRNKDPKMRGIPGREGWELRAEAGEVEGVLSREGHHQVVPVMEWSTNIY